MNVSICTVLYSVCKGAKLSLALNQSWMMEVRLGTWKAVFPFVVDELLVSVCVEVNQPLASRTVLFQESFKKDYFSVRAPRSSRNSAFSFFLLLFFSKCNCTYSGTSLIRSSKMRTPPSTGHHQESSCFCFVCFCQINLGGASGLVACARMAIITLYSVLHYIISLASTTRRKRSMLTLEKKLEIIGELKKGKSLRCVSGLYDVPKSTVVSHSQTL